MTLLNICCVGR